MITYNHYSMIHEIWTEITQSLWNGVMYFTLGACLIYPMYYIHCYYIEPPDEKINVQTPLEKYLEERKNDFLFQIKHYDENKEMYNKNIQPIFYDHDAFQNEIKKTNNCLEDVWKHRILFEYTPSGNVYMYYDAYRKAFTYYADKNMSYLILNAVAMKYIRIFYCFDFFIDNQVLPDTHINPFNSMEEEQDKKEKQKKEDKKKEMGINFDGAPFLKPKKKESAAKPNENSDKNEEKQAVNSKIIYRNIFKFNGTFRYTDILEQPKPVQNIVSSNNILFGMGEAPKSYKDFKLNRM